jgi:branched-chain amino acid transport system substrate-binding protein
MRVDRIRSGRLAAVIAALAIVAAACAPAVTPTPPPGAETPPPAEETPAAGEPIQVCELAYYTGEFAPFGPQLTLDVVFPIEEVINLDPPLGRPWELYHEDLGTVGESMAARTCLEVHGADIVVNIAHGYRPYRDWMIEWWQEHDSPLAPTVHGGAIPGNLGGRAAEPLFRAMGLDEGLGVSAVIYAEMIGAERIVIFATHVEGFQLAADATEQAARELGIEVLARIDVPAELPSYRAEAERIVGLQPDAVLIQAGSIESGTIIRQVAEAGGSLYWIGEAGWALAEFIETLGVETIATQREIGFTTFAPNKESPAWEFFQPLRDGMPQYNVSYGADSAYAYSTYDLLILTALAVEWGGSYLASDWAPAMFEVSDPPGEVCHTYAECLALIREGQDIDYEGITGPGTFTSGGVNAISPSYLRFLADGTLDEAQLLDAARWLEVTDAIKREAECDPAEPPNVCRW